MGLSRMRGLGAGCLLLGAVSGCSYLTDRGKDFLDIWWLELGMGHLLDVDFQVTEAIHSGIGMTMWVKLVALERRHVVVWRGDDNTPSMATWGLLFVRSSALMPYCEERDRFGYLWNFVYLPNYFADEPYVSDIVMGKSRLPLPRNVSQAVPWINLLDVDVGACVVPLAARVGVSPGEMLDFLLGWLGIDIAKDDASRKASSETEGESATRQAMAPCGERGLKSAPIFTSSLSVEVWP